MRQIICVPLRIPIGVIKKVLRSNDIQAGVDGIHGFSRIFAFIGSSLSETAISLEGVILSSRISHCCKRDFRSRNGLDQTRFMYHIEHFYLDDGTGVLLCKHTLGRTKEPCLPGNQPTDPFKSNEDDDTLFEKIYSENSPVINGVKYMYGFNRIGIVRPGEYVYVQGVLARNDICGFYFNVMGIDVLNDPDAESAGFLRIISQYNQVKDWLGKKDVRRDEEQNHILNNETRIHDKCYEQVYFTSTVHNAEAGNDCFGQTRMYSIVSSACEQLDAAELPGAEEMKIDDKTDLHKGVNASQHAASLIIPTQDEIHDMLVTSKPYNSETMIRTQQHEEGNISRISSPSVQSVPTTVKLTMDSQTEYPAGATQDNKYGFNRYKQKDRDKHVITTECTLLGKFKHYSENDYESQPTQVIFNVDRQGNFEVGDAY